MPVPHDVPPGGPPPVPARPTPTAVRLERLLTDLDDATLDTVTNAELAARLRVSSRSVTTALSRLAAAGRLTIHTRRSHPLTDRTGRSLRLTGRQEGGR